MLARILGSAAVAAGLLASDLVLLVLFLNPDVSLRREAVSLFVSLLLPYVVGATLLFTTLALALSALGAPRLPRPPLPSWPWFTGLASAAVSIAAVLFWWNLFSYRYSIPVEFVRALTASAVALAGAAFVLVGVGLDGLLFPLRARSLAAPLVVLAAASSVVVPLAFRPVPAPRPHPTPVATERVEPLRRITLIGIDGLGPAQVDSGIARGTLGALGRLLRKGAYGPLASFRPTEGPPLWTSIFTGRLPRDHGVKSFATYRLRLSSTPYELLPKGALVGVLERLHLVDLSPVTAASRQRPALWDALNAFGIHTGVVRFWGTHPPEHVQGFMLSNHFHRMRQRIQAIETLYPQDMFAEVANRALAPADVDLALVSRFVDLSGDAPADDAWRRDLVDRALAPDLTYQRAGAVLRAAYDPPFFATYFYGLDVVGHAFTRYAEPDRFGDVAPDDARRFGRVPDQYTAFLGQWVGDAERDLRPGEILMVVSSYGMEVVPWWRRLLDGALGGSRMSGTHEAAPDGFLFAIGDGVRAGAPVHGASLLDVAPTILYLMGLPVARDMEGRVVTEILEPEFLAAHPVTFIPSYESLAVAPISAAGGNDLPPLPEEIP
jgi:predicted AlkP superfamily phosphohydrolase/phosphomutase